MVFSPETTRFSTPLSGTTQLLHPSTTILPFSLYRFKEFKALVENQIEKKIKLLRIDNGGDFCGKQFEEFCKKYGIAR